METFIVMSGSSYWVILITELIWLWSWCLNGARFIYFYWVILTIELFLLLSCSQVVFLTIDVVLLMKWSYHRFSFKGDGPWARLYFSFCILEIKIYRSTVVEPTNIWHNSSVFLLKKLNMYPCFIAE